MKYIRKTYAHNTRTRHLETNVRSIALWESWKEMELDLLEFKVAYKTGFFKGKKF